MEKILRPRFLRGLFPTTHTTSARRLLNCRTAFVLLFSSVNDDECAVGKRSLKLERCPDWSFRRGVDLLRRRESDGHCLAMDRRRPPGLHRSSETRRGRLVDSPSFTFRTQVQRVQMPAKNASDRVSSKANHTGGRVPSGKCSFSEKFVNGTGTGSRCRASVASAGI